MLATHSLGIDQAQRGELSSRDGGIFQRNTSQTGVTFYKKAAGPFKTVRNFTKRAPGKRRSLQPLKSTDGKEEHHNEGDGKTLKVIAWTAVFAPPVETEVNFTIVHSGGSRSSPLGERVDEFKTCSHKFSEHNSSYDIDIELLATKDQALLKKRPSGLSIVARAQHAITGALLGDSPAVLIHGPNRKDSTSGNFSTPLPVRNFINSPPGDYFITPDEKGLTMPLVSNEKDGNQNDHCTQLLKPIPIEATLSPVRAIPVPPATSPVPRVDSPSHALANKLGETRLGDRLEVQEPQEIPTVRHNQQLQPYQHLHLRPGSVIVPHYPQEQSLLQPPTWPLPETGDGDGRHNLRTVHGGPFTSPVLPSHRITTSRDPYIPPHSIGVPATLDVTVAVEAAGLEQSGGVVGGQGGFEAPQRKRTSQLCLHQDLESIENIKARKLQGGEKENCGSHEPEVTNWIGGVIDFQAEGPQGFPTVLPTANAAPQDAPAAEETLPDSAARKWPDIFISGDSQPGLKLSKSNSSSMLTDLLAAEAEEEKREQTKSVPTMHSSTELDIVSLEDFPWPERNEGRCSLDGHMP